MEIEDFAVSIYKLTLLSQTRHGTLCPMVFPMFEIRLYSRNSSGLNPVERVLMVGFYLCGFKKIMRGTSGSRSVWRRPLGYTYNHVAIVEFHPRCHRTVFDVSNLHSFLTILVYNPHVCSGIQLGSVLD